VMLVVNVASACGLTPQYADLEAIYETYRDRGLVKRLVDAAPTDSLTNGGGIDVLAP